MRKMRIKLSKREVLLISLLAVTALLYGYLSYFIFPSYTRITELETELMMKRKVAVDREEARKKLQVLDSYLEKSRLELECMEKMIPYNVRLPELVVNIDNKVSDLGMDIKSIAIGEPDAANKEYAIVPVKVSMVGKYDSIIEFIRYIENNERKFIIDSFDLAPEKRGEIMPFDIAMRTFVLKDPQRGEVPEPDNYSFFKHDNGKSYPFLDVKKAPVDIDKEVTNEIEEMQKKIESLNDKFNKVNETFPIINETSEGS